MNIVWFDRETLFNGADGVVDLASSHLRRKVPARLQTSAQFVRITTVGSAHYRILCFRDCSWGRCLMMSGPKSLNFVDLPRSFQEVCLLSNGRYSVMLTASGGGYSALKGMDVTRWREDVTCDCWCQYCYIRNLDDGRVWSVGRQPLRPLCRRRPRTHDQPPIWALHTLASKVAHELEYETDRARFLGRRSLHKEPRGAGYWRVTFGNGGIGVGPCV